MARFLLPNIIDMNTVSKCRSNVSLNEVLNDGLKGHTFKFPRVSEQDKAMMESFRKQLLDQQNNNDELSTETKSGS